MVLKSKRVAKEGRTEGRRGASQWNVAWRRFKRNKTGIAGLFIVSAFVFMGIFSDWIAPYPKRSISLLFAGQAGQAPSWAHPFGTMSVGMDLLSEVIHATRNNLFIALSAVTVSTLIAIAVGSLAGYFGGTVDDFLMRLTEMFLVVPVFFIALVLLRVAINFIVAGYGIYMIVLILSVFYWAANARLVRGEFLRVRERPFVEAARALGAGSTRIIFRHILPSVLPSIIVVTSIGMAEITIIEAAIGFLGFSDPNTVTWGLLLQEGFAQLRLEWWGAIFPGLTVLVFALGFNLLGDGLQDALNPRLRE